jgi:hypothetical protein
MAALDSGGPNHIQVLCQPVDISELSLQVISNINERIDCCFDSEGLSFIMENESLYRALTSIRSRGGAGIRSRLVTEITKESTNFCNLMMKYGGDVFHNDGVKGNFVIVDGRRYLCYLFDNDEGRERIATQLVYATKAKSFVGAQQYLFDNLCYKAIPAREKIRELSKGIRGNFIDNIDDAYEIQKVAIDLLKSASYEILLLFSTVNSFYRAEYAGMLNLMYEAAEHGVSIKVLIQADYDNTVAETIQKKIRKTRLSINTQYISRKPLQAKITTIVIDQAVSLAIEVADDTKKTFEEATGIAIYSNNESTVSSCLSIFETLWIQSEFDKQNKIKQAYFQVFKGFKLMDDSIAAVGHLNEQILKEILLVS